jgi:Raf kinase inhibitor-like YbhB/YbcL family protein
MMMLPSKTMHPCAALILLWFSIPALAAEKGNFQIRVSGLGANAEISNDFALNQFGCQGKNLSPEISWSGAPAGTRSFALAVWDSDAPKAGGFYHWTIANIPSSMHVLPAGAGNPQKQLAPAGTVQLRNDYGEKGYGGPCPPGRQIHHYHFSLFALKEERLAIDEGTSPSTVAAKLRKENLAAAEVIATYHR